MHFGERQIWLIENGQTRLANVFQTLKEQQPVDDYAF